MVVWLCMDRRDEYQLVTFILEFKVMMKQLSHHVSSSIVNFQHMRMPLDDIQALMFISIGIVSVLIGAAESYLCLTIDPEVSQSYSTMYSS